MVIGDAEKFLLVFDTFVKLQNHTPRHTRRAERRGKGGRDCEPDGRQPIKVFPSGDV